MAYSLSFSDDFYCDGDPNEMEASDKPTCLYQAILQFVQEKPREYCKLVKKAKLVNRGVESKFILSGEMIAWDFLAYVRHEVNTCSNLSSPVEVWLDEQGYNTVKIYEKE